MAIRTQTIEQAASIFARHYQDHLSPNSPAMFIDPRECNQCMRAWEDLKFALDKNEPQPEVMGKLTIVPNDTIIDLFGRKLCR